MRGKRHSMSRSESALLGYEAETRDFIETHMVDPDGILYDAINCDTGRPFSKQEMAQETDEDAWAKKVDAPAQFAPFTNYEDSDMATADYLVSQIYRYQVTADDEALSTVRRCFAAIRGIAGEGAKHSPGFLPKPYGGIQGASHSRETSIDQYTKVVLALDLFRTTVATRAEKQQAEDLIVSFAEFWDRRNCTTMWFGQLVPWNGPHPNAALLYLMALAYQLTRRKAFLRWYELYLERREKLWSWSFCSGNMASLIVRSMTRLLDLRPEEATLWRRAGRHNYYLAVKSLHSSGYCRANPPNDEVILHGVSTQLATSAVPVAELLHTQAPLSLVRKILLKTGFEGRIYHTRLMDDRSVTQTHHLEAKKISGYYMAGWQLAYWHWRTKF